VRVTPSTRRSKRRGEHIKISETNAAGGSSRVRRISVPIGGKGEGEYAENSSVSDASSGRLPIEVDVLHNGSELSSSGGAPTQYMVPGSDISSMPPESTMDLPAAAIVSSRRRGGAKAETREVVERDALKAPAGDHDRGVSKERIIAQQVVEKLKRDGIRTKDSGKRRHGGSGDRKSRSRSVSNENFVEDVKTGKTRSSKVRDDSRERNLHPSEISVVSSRSAVSNTSINNPNILNLVEETVKKFILPEISALKEENQMLRNKSKFEESTRESRGSTSSRSRGETRGISKSSSLPDVAHRSDSVSEDHLAVHERSGRRRSSRRSSRDSDKSYEGAAREESTRRKVSREKDGNHGKEMLAAAAGLAVGVLGAKAGSKLLKHHSSTSSVDRDRRRRHKSEGRSRTSSLTESRSERRLEDFDREEDSHNYIPPLPMQSTLDSELTRDSILSADTERPASRSSLRADTPTKAIREVSRGSPLHVHTPGHAVNMGSPSSSREYHAEHGVATREVDDHASPSSNRSARMGYAAAGLGAAAGAAAVVAAAHYADRQGISPNRAVSPIQSENSYLNDREEIVEHPRVRSIKSNNSVSAERKRRKSDSPVSASSSPTGIIRSKKRPEGISLESPYEILPEDDFTADTPRADDFDQWLQREHAQNERYREELDRESLISRSDVDDYPDTAYADDSHHEGLVINTTRNIGTVGANPEYVSTPDAAISAVASLQNPSVISVHSSTRSLQYDDRPLSQADSYAMEQEQFVAPVAASRFPGTGSKQHWELVRDRYMAMTDGNDRDFVSPAQSETRSVDEKPIMHSNYVPIPGDMPDFSYAPQDEDDLQTNPSIIEGKLGEGIEMSPYPAQHIGHEGDHHLKDAALLGTAAGVVGLGLAAATKKNTGSHNSYELDDDIGHPHNEPGTSKDIHGTVYSSSPAQNKDEGYISANPGPMSPVPHPLDTKDIDETYVGEYNEGMDMDDPFLTKKHLRHESGLSHGMASPLYDSATGKGIDRIQSKDIVALMDHLTVRDAQRNARDTEILVTLVRSATEMRNNFDEIKRFITEQDRLRTDNVDRGQEATAQRLGGPRPIPTNSPRTRKSSEDTDDIPTKRRNIVKRALKGLSMRSSNDLAKIEDMLMHLLQEVEGLKTSQVLQRPSQPHTRTTSLNSYENLRAAPDSGYEPEGRAGTNSSPAQSGYLSNNSSRHINGMHSGYGLRGSDGNRISTVLEGDEEGDDGTRTPTNNKYSANDSTTPPTKEKSRSIPLETPPEQSAQFSADPTPRTDKSKSRHKSITSTIFGNIGRTSRWSKTTASTVPDSAPNSAKKNRPYSTASRSGSDLQDYEKYNANEVDALHSGESLTDDHNRAGSPLFPEDYDYDDPKYQVHRNSLNLQHPQPRPGPTNRHQSHLETQAMVYENPPTPDVDQWGSAPALALNKSRFSAASTAPRQSPVHSDDGYSLQSDELDAPPRGSKVLDDGPLVPPKVGLSSSLEPSYGMYGVPLMNSGMHIASSLAPIEEVRKSLETDRSSVRHVSFISGN
jgi:hypothetical protein